MNKKRGVVLTFCLALLFALAAPHSVLADEWDQATKLTFSGPVEVPGLVLSAGTYWFRLADNDSDRHIVQIWNADRTQLLTTVIAIPDYRMQPTDNTVINFEERPSGSPEAIKAWFYPGADSGQEFVYPKTRATQLAKQTNRPVLTMPDKQAAQVKTAPVKAVTPSGEVVEVAEVVAPQAVVAQAPQGSLPQTGSDVPLLALLGALALAGAGVLRVVARQVA